MATKHFQIISMSYTISW